MKKSVGTPDLQSKIRTSKNPLQHDPDLKKSATLTSLNLPNILCTWVVLQKLTQLSDTHFSQVLNKLEKQFFHGFIKYHLPLRFI